MVKIEIDGKAINADDGAMVIEAADAAGVFIPRFCYHKKLSVAANCRMCLIEVEKARKPLPACATPVTDGMKIKTKSKNAVSAQKGVMEFLLINHPLDCPICDQGGECELQDIAMGYGNDVSRFTELKRVVPDKNIGPLISTEMTRCIHCTRCVRFGEEIAGIKELGATGRGEHMQIGTYIEQAVDSEMSGNVIDLCPVGALTSKPFRYTLRSWEMQQRESIAAHDCIGSNVAMHVHDKEVKRVVPIDNEDINETWLSDRDRFSYQGWNSDKRLLQPKIKENGEWKTVDWETALNKAFTGLNKVLNDSTDQVGFLASPNATTEELYLLQKFARSQGVNNIDHRLRQRDFASQDQLGTFRSLGQNIADLEKLDSALLIGSNVRKEQPIVGHRIRKAAIVGAKISFINTRKNEFRFPVLANIAVKPQAMIDELGKITAAAISLNKNAKLSDKTKKQISGLKPGENHTAIAQSLIDGEKATIILGPQAIHHINSSEIEALAFALSQIVNSTFGYLTDGANSSGASVAGALPHRVSGGSVADNPGKTANEMLENGLNAYVLLNVEPEFDTANPVQSLKSLNAAEFVVALSAYDNANQLTYADVILPISTSSETAGTFCNIAGEWQSFNGCAPPKGEARPAWKVVRVLANLFDADGFDYISIEDIYSELEAHINSANANIKTIEADFNSKNDDQLSLVGGTATYCEDVVLRHAPALQATSDAMTDCKARMSPATASSFGLSDGDIVELEVDGNKASTELIVDPLVCDNCVYLPSGSAVSSQLPAIGATVSVKKITESKQNAENTARVSNA